MLNQKIVSHVVTPITVVLLTLLTFTAFQLPAHAGDRFVNPKNVLSVITADWNDDGRFDRAVLSISENDPGWAELFLFLSDAAANRLTLSAYHRNIAWVGSLWGTLPSLAMHKTGSLIITSANESIGRNRWTEKLTVAYREHHFIVAGYTYSAYDTLDPAAKIDCDVNLRTGKGLKNGQDFRTSAISPALADWSNASMPVECRQ